MLRGEEGGGAGRQRGTIGKDSVFDVPREGPAALLLLSFRHLAISHVCLGGCSLSLWAGEVEAVHGGQKRAAQYVQNPTEFLPSGNAGVSGSSPREERRGRYTQRRVLVR